MTLPKKIYTDLDLARARKKGKVVGWLQGGVIAIGAAVIWNLVGWIPTVLVVGAVGYVAYKLLARPSAKPDADT